jgi:hypothetical protein
VRRLWRSQSARQAEALLDARDLFPHRFFIPARRRAASAIA